MRCSSPRPRVISLACPPRLRIIAKPRKMTWTRRATPSPAAVMAPRHHGNTISPEQSSQEIRIASNGHGSFQWLTGLFYGEHDCVDSLGSSSPAVPAITGGATDLLFEVYAPLQIEQRAWFGNASYQFTDRLKLTAGLRYFSYDADTSSASSGLLYTGSSYPRSPPDRQKMMASTRWLLSHTRHPKMYCCMRPRRRDLEKATRISRSRPVARLSPCSVSRIWRRSAERALRFRSRRTRSGAE